MEYLIPIGKSGSIIIIPWHIGLVGLVTCDGFVGRPISNLRKMMSYTYMSYSEPAAKPVVFMLKSKQSALQPGNPMLLIIPRSSPC